MSGYKAMPMKPTPEMVEAAEDIYMPSGDMDLAIRAAVLTAPEVQGEPVAHLRRDQLQQIKTRGPVVGEISPSPRGDMVAVYAAPQPTEQQSISPTLASEAAKHLSNWLEMDMCECEFGHTCGYNEVKRTRDALLVVAGPQPELAKYQPCGCVICTCEHETQCQGCGGHHCGTHPVGQFLGPVYQQPAPDVSALVEALESAYHLIANHSGETLPTSYASDQMDMIDAALAAHRKQPEGEA